MEPKSPTVGPDNVTAAPPAGLFTETKVVVPAPARVQRRVAVPKPDKVPVSVPLLQLGAPTGCQAFTGVLVGATHATVLPAASVVALMVL